MEYTLNSNSIYDFNHLNFDFDYKNRFINCFLDNEKKFIFETPFLKVLKPMHISNSKKNTETNKYIILETFSELQNNNEFMVIIDKIHEISQENIKKNSKSWFNIELDEYGLDMKVRRPIDNQKNIQFIKIIIGNNQTLLNKINTLEKNIYISMKINYKGLRVLSDNLTEEWELIDFITQDEYDKNTINLQNIEIETFLENKLNLNNFECNNLNNELNNMELKEDNELKIDNNQEFENNKLEKNKNEIQEDNILEKYNNEEQENNEDSDNKLQDDSIIKAQNNLKNSKKINNKVNLIEKNSKKNIIVKKNKNYIKRKHKVLIW